MSGKEDKNENGIITKSANEDRNRHQIVPFCVAHHLGILHALAGVVCENLQT